MNESYSNLIESLDPKPQIFEYYKDSPTYSIISERNKEDHPNILKIYTAKESQNALNPLKKWGKFRPDYTFYIEESGKMDIYSRNQGIDYDELGILITTNQINKIELKSLKSQLELPEILNWHYKFDVDDNKSLEEYFIFSKSGELLIVSRSRKGLFYGILTIKQIFRYITCEDEDFSNKYVKTSGLTRFPQFLIHDWPDLSYRMIHLDLKKQMYTTEYYKILIKKFAEWKINSIIIEYEDKFPFNGKLSEIPNPVAFESEDIKSILDTAKKNFVEIIPLCQSLGHLDYVLHHDSFKDLREKPIQFSNKSSEMLCPQNPESFELIKEMYSQILSKHKSHPSKYFHIAMDETYHIGTCEKCKPIADTEGGKSRLYVEYANKIIEFLKSRGKIPIIWTDMLIKHPEFIDQLSKDAIMCYWEYNQPIPRDPSQYDPAFETIDWVRIDKIYGSKEISNTGIEPNLLNLYNRYIYPGNEKQKFRTFPFTKFFLDKNFRVICAPSVQCCRQTPIFPEYDRHIPNILGFIKNAISNNTMGIFLTNWVVRSALRENTSYGVCVGASASWNYSEFDLEKMSLAWFHQFYYIPLSDAEKMKNLFKDMGIKPYSWNWDELKEYTDKYLPILENIKEKVQNNPENFDFLYYSLLYLKFETDLMLFTDMLDKILVSYDSEEKSIPFIDKLNEYHKKLTEMSEHMGQLELRLQSLLEQLEDPIEIKEEISLRFDYLRDILNHYKNFINSFLRNFETLMTDIIKRNTERFNQKNPKNRMDSLVE